MALRDLFGNQIGTDGVVDSEACPGVMDLWCDIQELTRVPCGYKNKHGVHEWVY